MAAKATILVVDDEANNRNVLVAQLGGDDYELLFTTPPAQRERVAQLGAELGLVLSRIGQIEAEPGLRLWRGANAVAEPAEGRKAVPNRWTSFDHFKGAA